MGTDDNIKYLAIARAKDKEIVCSFAPLLKNPSLRVDSLIYMNMTKKVLEAPSFKDHVEANVVLLLENAPNKVHLLLDDEDRVYILICADTYPSRIANQCVKTLHREFVVKCGEKAKNCTAGGCTKEFAKNFSRIAKEYDEPSKLDKVSEVSQQVDQVKIVMQDNIQNVLQNTEKMETVEEKTNQLNEQAKVFRNTGRNLQRKMWWKNLKANIMIGTMIVLVFILILAAAGVFNGSDNNDGGQDNITST